MPTAVSEWTNLVNREAEELAVLANIPQNSLRGHLRDRLVEHHAFPLVVQARCLVVGERQVGGRRYIEMVPEGLTTAAAALTGPFLVAWERPLQEGSVVRGIFSLQDPRAYQLEQVGLLCRMEAPTVEVPVEP